MKSNLMEWGTLVKLNDINMFHQTQIDPMQKIHSQVNSTSILVGFDPVCWSTFPFRLNSESSTSFLWIIHVLLLFFLSLLLNKSIHFLALHKPNLIIWYHGTKIYTNFHTHQLLCPYWFSLLACALWVWLENFNFCKQHNTAQILFLCQL